MALFPVSSKMLGVIHGYAASSTSFKRTLVTLRTHLEHEPPSEVDTADFLGSIRKARREREHTLRQGKSYKRRGKQSLH
jgi:hypothetical protein